MNEQIAYYKRQIEQRKNISAIHHLGKLNHTDAIEVLIEIATSNVINERIREATIPVLIATGDACIADIVIEHYAEIYPTSYSILHHIHKLNDKRVVPALIETLYRLPHIRDRGRYGVIAETISALARIGDERAIPVLIDLLERYPFESKTDIMPVEAYGILALDALGSFDSDEANTLHQEWQARFDAHLDYHLVNDTIFQDVKRKLAINRLIISRAKVIDYLLNNIDARPLSQQMAIIKEIGLKVFPLIRFTDIMPRVIDAFIRLAQESDHADLRRTILRRLCNHRDERIIPLALAALDDPKLSAYAVRILSNHEYRAIEPRIISILEQRIPTNYDTQYYIHYLGMTATAAAEQAIIRYIQTAAPTDNLTEAYIVLGKMAQTSDDALTFIIEAIDDNNVDIQKIAIAALNQTGERAIAILVSLLDADYLRRVAAIKALAAPAFADAVPHLMQVLLSERYGTSSLVLRTLQAIGTESAFATINAWETRKRSS